MKLILILAVIIILGAFFVFQYNLVKTTASSSFRDQTQYVNDQNVQTEKRMDNYGGKIDDINSASKNAYDESGL
jgi:uncharacterized protein YxeA